MGPFSLTGQPNAMGGREVGGLANQLAAHMDFAPENVDRVRRFWSAPRDRRAARPQGRRPVRRRRARRRSRPSGSCRRIPSSACRTPSACARALERCELVVVSDCVRDTDTTRVRARVAAGRDVGREVRHRDELRAAHLAAAQLPAACPARARPDWWIVTEVARRMGFGARVRVRLAGRDLSRARAPLGVRERRRARLRHRRARGRRATPSTTRSSRSNGRARPAASRRRGCSPTAASSRASGKAQLVPTPPRAPAQRPSSDYPLVLNTGRVRDQWHTMTRTGRSARLSGHHAEPFVQVHPLDAARFGLTVGDLAEVRERRRRASSCASRSPTPWRRVRSSCRCTGAACSRATRASAR